MGDTGGGLLPDCLGRGYTTGGPHLITWPQRRAARGCGIAMNEPRSLTFPILVYRVSRGDGPWVADTPGWGVASGETRLRALRRQRAYLAAYWRGHRAAPPRGPREPRPSVVTDLSLEHVTVRLPPRADGVQDAGAPRVCVYCGGTRNYPWPAEPMWPCPLFGGGAIHRICCHHEMDEGNTPRRHGWTPEHVAATCNACGKYRREGAPERRAEDYQRQGDPALFDWEAELLLPRIAATYGLGVEEVRAALAAGVRPDSMGEPDWVLAQALAVVRAAWDAREQEQLSRLRAEAHCTPEEARSRWDAIWATQPKARRGESRCDFESRWHQWWLGHRQERERLEAVNTDLRPLPRHLHPAERRALKRKQAKSQP